MAKKCLRIKRLQDLKKNDIVLYSDDRETVELKVKSVDEKRPGRFFVDAITTDGTNIETILFEKDVMEGHIKKCYE